MAVRDRLQVMSPRPPERRDNRGSLLLPVWMGGQTCASSHLHIWRRAPGGAARSLPRHTLHHHVETGVPNAPGGEARVAHQAVHFRGGALTTALALHQHQQVHH